MGCLISRNFWCMCRTAAEVRLGHYRAARPTLSRGVTAFQKCAVAVWSACASAAFCASGAHAAELQAEIQLNLCSDPAQVVQRLQLAQEGKLTTVWLFDTATQDLYRDGLRLRLRERGKRSELTLKIAGQNCLQTDPVLLNAHGKCEADLHGDAFDDVVSLTRSLDAQARAALLAPAVGRGAPLAAALSAVLDTNQRALLARRRGTTAGAPLIPQDIARLGPSTVRAYRHAKQPYVVEVWTLPGGAKFVELSQKLRRGAALARRSEIQQEVAAKGVVICADQDSQAQRKLELLVE
ncbi:MAG: hypothetical protein H6R02_1008 [Burkholderiaceae bacterium]|nr:hypothetical protein [Burkholderiaceae bacterium]